MLKKLTDILTSFPHVRLWYLILFILSVACLIDVPGAPVFGMSKFTQIVFTVSVSAFKASLLIIFAAWLWRYRKARILLIILLVLYIIVAITNVGAFAFYGFGMSRKLISLIAQTNPSEASEFIPDIISHLGLLLSSFWTWIAVIIAILTGVLFCKLPRIVVILITGALNLTGLGMYTWLFFSFDTAKTSIAMSLRIPKYFMDQRRWNLEMQQRIDNKKPLPHPESVKSEHAAANVVVIIGESSNRPNLSLYGFPLQTSPYMDSMA
ncbi:MAG: hypothetical protein K2K00_04140, partial [Muribaculaceae bacterium]|nr:hypothetical protein [Muribaculaceae bacterium]